MQSLRVLAPSRYGWHEAQILPAEFLDVAVAGSAAITDGADTVAAAASSNPPAFTAVADLSDAADAVAASATVTGTAPAASSTSHGGRKLEVVKRTPLYMRRRTIRALLLASR